MTTPTREYLVTLVEALHMLRRELLWLRSQDDSVSLVLASITRALGAFPVGLHWVGTLYTNPSTREAVENLVTLKEKYKIDYETLIKEPLSLPVTTPLQSEHCPRDMLKKHFPRIIKNRAVRNLFDFHADTQKILLVNDLVAMRPFNLRLANKLYSLSNFRLQEKYLSKFSGARSIQQATIGA